MTHFTFLSVCSGIGGAELSFAGMAEPIGMAEIAPFPRLVLQARFPTIPLHSDFTALITDPPVTDILAGGCPCQAFSMAGARRSLDDARGNLTLAFAMLLDAIDGRNAGAGRPPATCFYENVPGILSTKDNAFGCLIGELAGHGAALLPPGGTKWSNAGLVVGPKRQVGWRTLDAQYFGLAQRRRRVFVVASARAGFDPREVLSQPKGLQRHHPPSRQTGQEVTGTLAARTGAGGGLGTDFDLAGDLVPETVGALCANGKSAGSATQQDAQNGFLMVEPITFDWQAGGGGSDTSFRGKSRSYIVDTPGRTRSLIACKTLAVLTQEPIAFTCKDYGGDAAVGIAPTLRSMGHDGSHANGGGQLAVAFGGNRSAGPIDVSPALNACKTASGRMDFATEALLVEPMPFDLQQVTCPTNMTRVEPGLPVGTLSTASQPHVAYAASFQPRVARNGRGSLSELVPTLAGADAGATSDMRPCVLIAHAFDARQSDVIQYGPITGPLDTDGHTIGLLTQCATGDIAHTLTAEGFDASEDGSGRGIPIIGMAAMEPIAFQSSQSGVRIGPAHATLDANNGSRRHNGVIAPTTAGLVVRRLTPVECERLQGLPDSWTDIPVRGKPAPDGPRYKAIGNGWAINCTRWVAQRLIAHLRDIEAADALAELDNLLAEAA